MKPLTQKLEHAIWRCRTGRKTKQEFLRTIERKVRLNKVENEFLLIAAAAAKCSSAEYMRRSFMQNHPPVIPEINRQLAIEIGKFGNNLNQIARHFNSNEYVQFSEIEKLLAQVKSKIMEYK